MNIIRFNRIKSASRTHKVLLAVSWVIALTAIAYDNLNCCTSIPANYKLTLSVSLILIMVLLTYLLLSNDHIKNLESLISNKDNKPDIISNKINGITIIDLPNKSKTINNEDKLEYIKYLSKPEKEFFNKFIQSNEKSLYINTDPMLNTDIQRLINNSMVHYNYLTFSNANYEIDDFVWKSLHNHPELLKNG